MKREQILIVEDEPDIVQVLEYNLGREGFRVTSCSDGGDAVLLARKMAPELVILDLMLPGLDGTEVCRRLKEDPVTRSTSIVMLTAKGEESDVVLGLGLGADDYITKPFRPKEVVARIKAVLRRGQLRDEKGESERVVHEGLVIDTARHEVLVDSQPVTLTPTEFRLLHILAAHPGRVFDREALINRVITDHALVGPRNIDVHIRSVRRKLAGRKEYLETIRGVGYRFNPTPGGES